MKHSLITWFLAPAILLVVLPFSAFARTPDSDLTPAKPTESQDRTYRTIGGRSIIAIVSSDELEMRQGGDNIVCKYTENDGKLRVIVNMLGTTTAKYFNLTPQGLVDEDGEVFYEPETFRKITAQIQLNTELLEAVNQDDAGGIDALVAKGAVVESRNNQGAALMIAINDGLTNAVGALLKNGANPNQKAEGDGKTPLMTAAGWHGGWGGVSRKPEYDKIVSMLCDAKVDLNAIDKSGNTALMLSLMNKNLEATKILVAAGADRNIQNSAGRDAFSLAKGDGDKIAALVTDSDVVDGINAGVIIDATVSGVVIVPQIECRYKVFIDDESDDRSSGITKIGRLITFIPNARRGQTAIVDVTRVRERWADADLVKVLSAVDLPPKPLRAAFVPTSTSMAPDVVVGAEMDVVVTELSERISDTTGVAKVGGLVVFVEGATAIGESINVRIVDRRERLAFAEPTGKPAGNEPLPVQMAGAPAARAPQPSFVPPAGALDANIVVGSELDVVITEASPVHPTTESVARGGGGLVIVVKGATTIGQAVNIRITERRERLAFAELTGKPAGTD